MSATLVFSFAEFKKRFYSRFPSISVFDCGQINLVKVVLDGLKVQYSSRGKAGHMMNHSVGMYRLKLWARRRVKSGAEHRNGVVLKDYFKHAATRSYLFVDHTNRIVEGPDGKSVSLYYCSLLNGIGREEIAFVNENPQPLMSDVDIKLCEFADRVKSSPLDSEEQKFRKQLTEFYTRISPLFETVEQHDIGIALEKFFEEYRVWRFALKYLPQKSIVILCHYHHEGAIWAMREAGRKVIELQHGLISEEDIFYCFPPSIESVRDKALFPDVICTYGEYWKSMLLRGNEFVSSQIQVLGYYLYQGSNVSTVKWEEFVKSLGGSKVILITTQTFLHDHFIKYARWLSSDIRNRKLNYTVLVKTHPSESMDLYSELNEDPVIKLVNHPLTSLFSITDLHVSIYSTTLYEAMRFGIRNFSLDVEPSLSGYVNSVLRDGIATRIGGTENPVDVAEPASRTRDVNYYFAALDADRLVMLMK